MYKLFEWERTLVPDSIYTKLLIKRIEAYANPENLVDADYIMERSIQ